MKRLIFRRWILIWFSVLIGFNLLLPLLVAGLVSATSCGEGACGAAAAVYGMILKPAGFLVFGAAILWSTHSRLRHMKFHLLWTLGVALCLIGAAPFLMRLGNFWGANLGLGLIWPQSSSTLFLFGALGVFLTLTDLSQPAKNRKHEGWAWTVAMAAFASALVLSQINIIIGLRSLTSFLGTVASYALDPSIVKWTAVPLLQALDTYSEWIVVPLYRALPLGAVGPALYMLITAMFCAALLFLGIRRHPAPAEDAVSQSE